MVNNIHHDCGVVLVKNSIQTKFYEKNVKLANKSENKWVSNK